MCINAVYANEYDERRMKEILAKYEPGSEEHRICKDLIEWRPEMLEQPARTAERTEVTPSGIPA